MTTFLRTNLNFCAPIANCLEQRLSELHTVLLRTNSKAAHNSTYPKGGVSCSKDSFVDNGSLVFQIKFCGKISALRVAAKRYASF